MFDSSLQIFNIPVFTTLSSLVTIMVQILRFRTVWGIEPGPNYDHWKKWFPTLKQQGYGMRFILTIFRVQKLKSSVFLQ